MVDTDSYYFGDVSVKYEVKFEGFICVFLTEMLSLFFPFNRLFEDDILCLVNTPPKFTEIYCINRYDAQRALKKLQNNAGRTR